MKRTVCLVVIFLLAQVLSSLAVLLSFGSASRRTFGCERIGGFSIGLGYFSVIERGCGMGSDDFVEMDRP